jgi:hypothetical protein
MAPVRPTDSVAAAAPALGDAHADAQAAAAAECESATATTATLQPGGLAPPALWSFLGAPASGARAGARERDSALCPVAADRDGSPLPAGAAGGVAPLSSFAGFAQVSRRSAAREAAVPRARRQLGNQAHARPCAHHPAGRLLRLLPAVLPELPARQGGAGDRSSCPGFCAGAGHAGRVHMGLHDSGGSARQRGCTGERASSSSSSAAARSAGGSSRLRRGAHTGARPGGPPPAISFTHHCSGL